jgi:hypothetical protein
MPDDFFVRPRPLRSIVHIGIPKVNTLRRVEVQRERLCLKSPTKTQARAARGTDRSRRFASLGSHLGSKGYNEREQAPRRPVL